MRRRLLLLADLGLVALATVAALVLRDNLAPSSERLRDFLPYLCETLLVAAPILMALGLDRSVWRLSAMSDYLRIVAVAVATVLGAIALGFAVDRLDGVARSLPILQAILMVFVLAGGRVIARLRFEARRAAPGGALAAAGGHGTGETVLVLGINPITDLYLRCVAEFAANRVRIAGLLGRRERHTGRLVRQLKVLGTPEALGQVLRDLEVHGVSVDRIVVTWPFEKLSAEAREALLKLEKTSDIRIDFFSEHVRPGARSGGVARRAGSGAGPDGGGDGFLLGPGDVEALLRRPYWRVKRLVDGAGALCLIFVSAPLMLFAAVLVTIGLGWPVTFWQQRPGRGGWPFKLYKFRTMAPAHDARGRLIPDEERAPAIGAFLRRFRLDELPQLSSILVGDMSLVGPRPLLPKDQPKGDRTRLLARPGLTGWAQVNGGRGISARDKAALDAWYLKNASLALDIEILWRTAVMVALGERRNGRAIRRAYLDLGLADADGVLDLGTPVAEEAVRLPPPAALEAA